MGRADRLWLFAGVDRVKSFSRQVVVVGGNGEAKTRLAKGEYLICEVSDFAGGNFIIVCDGFDITGDTTIEAGSSEVSESIWMSKGG